MREGADSFSVDELMKQRMPSADADGVSLLLFLPSRFSPPLFPRLQHHPRPEGAFPHVPDGGAAAAPGGAAGGRIHALHHHQTLRLLPVRHQRHHVTADDL